MKALAIFMSIMMFITGFDLCNDSALPDNKGKTEISKTEKRQAASGDACSPYCHCARCPFSLLPPNAITGIQRYDFNIRYFESSFSDRPIQMSNTVWQPPKFAV